MIQGKSRYNTVSTRKHKPTSSDGESTKDSSSGSDMPLHDGKTRLKENRLAKKGQSQQNEEMKTN